MAARLAMIASVWRLTTTTFVLLARSVVRVLAVGTATTLVIDLLSFGAPKALVWLDPSPLPIACAAAAAAAFAIAVLGYGLLPAPLRPPARWLVGAMAGWCLVDALRFWLALAEGRFTTAVPVPLSLGLALALSVWAFRPPSVVRGDAWWRMLGRLGLDGVVAVAALTALLLAFGHTDYRRPADAIVVFGAGVRGDGRPSPTLAARTATAVELWRQGLAQHLVLSGGRAEGVPVSEPQAMATMARALGVPSGALVIDENGVNTLATVRTASRLARERGWTRFLMVSQDYHLLRIKMFARRTGLDAFTVPAPERRGCWRWTESCVRELAAVGAYWLLPQLWS